MLQSSLLSSSELSRPYIEGEMSLFMRVNIFNKKVCCVHDVILVNRGNEIAYSFIKIPGCVNVPVF